jgi:hypothetical protein
MGDSSTINTARTETRPRLFNPIPKALSRKNKCLYTAKSHHNKRCVICTKLNFSTDVPVTNEETEGSRKAIPAA